MTARHCVSPISTGETIDNSSKFTGNYAANSLQITTQANMGAGGFRAGREIMVPSDSKSMGNDIALIILASNVPASEATPITPVVQHAIYNTKRYGKLFTAIGYGITGPGRNDSGVRRIRQKIDIKCVTGSSVTCDGITGPDGLPAVLPSEFFTGQGVCQGDSGSSAYDQKNFDVNIPMSLGVLSRGDQGSCDIAIYTRTDSHKDLIIAAAKRAATLGGYAEPAWTQPEAQDPEDAPFVGPARPDSSKPLGDSCGNKYECVSKVCLAPGDDKFVCTQACDDTKKCPDGFACDSGYCFKPTAPAASSSGGENPGDGTTTTTSSGCSTAGGKVQGGVLSVLGLGLLALRRRRRGVKAGA
jgi:MYXO-CTERM domain-containing protein